MALVDEDKAHVGLISAGGGHAGIEVHVIVQGDIIVAFRGGGDALLTQPGVDPAVDIAAMVVVLLNQQVGIIDPIHPVGHLLHILGLAGDGVDQHGTLRVRAAEQADALHQPGADPPRSAVLVDLEVDIAEHHGGIAEAQRAVEVAAEVLAGGILDTVAELDEVGLLSHHIDHDISGQALGTVIEPLDDISIDQRGHPN